MKLLIYIVCVFTSALSLVGAAEQDIRKIWTVPTPYLESIQKRIQAPETDLGNNKPLADDLQTMAYAINQEIMAAESVGWATPSTARKAVIEKWGKTLQPFTETLVGLALDRVTGQTGAGNQSRSLLDFAAPTQAFADQTRVYIKKSIWEAFAAADLLYEHRLLTNADKQALRDWRPAVGPELERWALGVSSLGLLDGLEIAKKVLAAQPQGDTPEEITRPYLNFLRIANTLGTEAAQLLPEIEALIANPAIKSSGYLTHFENARDIVTGKKARQGRVAKNGSGPLSPWLVAETSKQPGTTSSTVLPPLNRKAPSTAPTATPSEEPASSTPWSIIVVLIVAATGLLWLLVKKRK